MSTSALHGVAPGTPAPLRSAQRSAFAKLAVTESKLFLREPLALFWGMPEMDGVAAIKRLAEQGSPARVLVLTTYDTDSDVLSAIEAGATGYLLKDAPRAELLRAVRAAARGEAVLSPSVATRGRGYTPVYRDVACMSETTIIRVRRETRDRLNRRSDRVARPIPPLRRGRHARSIGEDRSDRIQRCRMAALRLRSAHHARPQLTAARRDRAARGRAPSGQLRTRRSGSLARIAPRIVNLAHWSAHLLHRLRRQAAQPATPTSSASTTSSRPTRACRSRRLDDGVAETGIVLPLRLRDGDELGFFSTISTFGTAVDITLAELAIEAFYPANARTANRLLEGVAPEPPPGRTRNEAGRRSGAFSLSARSDPRAETGRGVSSPGMRLGSRCRHRWADRRAGGKSRCSRSPRPKRRSSDRSHSPAFHDCVEAR